MSTSPSYIVAASNAAINSAATAGWVPLMRGPCAIGFQTVIAGTGAPNGTIFFEITDDDNPFNPQGVILGATALTLPSSMSPGQPIGSAINFLFDFNPAPSAKYMRARYAPSSGGSATVGSFLMGIHQRGLGAGG